jgi:transcription elongation factor GreA
MSDRVPITPAGAQKLKDEIKRLKEVERPAVQRAIQAARELGDISDSGDYRSAKERQAFIEGRLRELESKVARFQVIDPATVNAGSRVAFGAKVTVADANTGDESTYRIIGDDEADLKDGTISISSPLARALIGREEGDTVTVRTPRGEREMEIVAVRFGV